MKPIRKNVMKHLGTKYSEMYQRTLKTTWAVLGYH